MEALRPTTSRARWMPESTSDPLATEGPGSAQGEWTDGQVASVIPVRLEIRGESLTVVSLDGGSVLVAWPIGTLRMDSILDGDVTHIESTDQPGCTAATRDAAFVRRLRSRGARFEGLPSRGRTAIALGCAAGVVAIFACLYAAMPSLSRAIAMRIPLDVERKLDPEVSSLFNAQTCRTPESGAALRVLHDRLDPNGSVPADVRIVNIGVPNAFSLPGGSVLLTRGLVEEAQSGEEIAGVLAHELAHVKHRHVLAELIQDTFMSALWALTVGDYSGVLVVDPRTAQHLIELRHSREIEAEADRTGLKILANARVSPSGLDAFLQRNRVPAVDGALSFLSNHPQTAERLRMIHESPAKGGPPVLMAEELQALHDACKGMKEVGSIRELLR